MSNGSVEGVPEWKSIAIVFYGDGFRTDFSIDNLGLINSNIRDVVVEKKNFKKTTLFIFVISKEHIYANDDYITSLRNSLYNYTQDSSWWDAIYFENKDQDKYISNTDDKVYQIETRRLFYKHPPLHGIDYIFPICLMKKELYDMLNNEDKESVLAGNFDSLNKYTQRIYGSESKLINY